MTRTQATYALRPTGPALMSSCVGNEHAGNVHALHAGFGNGWYFSGDPKMTTSSACSYTDHASGVDSRPASMVIFGSPEKCHPQVRTTTTAETPGCAHGDTPLVHAESGLRARRLRALGACPQVRTSKPLSASTYTTLRHTSACHLAYGFDRVLSSRGSPLLLDCIGFGSKRGRKGGRCP